MLLLLKINSFNPFFNHYSKFRTSAIPPHPLPLCGQPGSRRMLRHWNSICSTVEHSDELSCRKFVASDSFAQWYIYYFIVAQRQSSKLRCPCIDGLYRPSHPVRDARMRSWALKASAALQMARGLTRAHQTAETSCARSSA